MDQREHVIVQRDVIERTHDPVFVEEQRHPVVVALGDDTGPMLIAAALSIILVVLLLLWHPWV